MFGAPHIELYELHELPLSLYSNDLHSNSNLYTDTILTLPRIAIQDIGVQSLPHSVHTRE